MCDGDLTAPTLRLTGRVLPPAEWPRLTGTELERVVGLLDPSWVQIYVVEEGPAIVGCWALANVWHLEGLWIAPAHRRTVSVGRRLWVGMRRLMASCGASAAVTAAISPDVDQMLSRAGVPLPGRFYVVKAMTEAAARPLSIS